MKRMKNIHEERTIRDFIKWDSGNEREKALLFVFSSFVAVIDLLMSFLAYSWSVFFNQPVIRVQNKPIIEIQDGFQRPWIILLPPHKKTSSISNTKQIKLLGMCQASRRVND